MSWLVASLVASVVLTIALNVLLRAFPGSGEARGGKLDELVERSRQDPGRRVWVPWKAMLVASLVLTVLLNVLLRLS